MKRAILLLLLCFLPLVHSQAIAAESNRCINGDYIANESGQLVFNARTALSLLPTSTTCNVYIISRNNTALVNNRPMTNIVNGFYNYTINFSAGRYYASVQCQDLLAADVFADAKEFSVVNSCARTQQVALGGGTVTFFLDLGLIPYLALLVLAFMVLYAYSRRQNTPIFTPAILLAGVGLSIMLLSFAVLSNINGIGISQFSNSTVTLNSAGDVTTQVNNLTPFNNQFVHLTGFALLVIGFAIIAYSAYAWFKEARA